MTPAPREAELTLRGFGDVFDALERLPVPIFAIGKNMRIRWLNKAARDLVGRHEGAQFTDAVAPVSLPTVRDQFARKVVGGVTSTEYEATLVRNDGSHVRVEISSVPVEEEHEILGVFGLAAVESDVPAETANPVLTPRQQQVLQLLSRGCSTEQMAGELGVARETVRNHVRAILKALRVHSRLEAVVEGHRRGLV
jgi:DNA-binding CsgD family transcriptional regulator